MQTLQLKTYSKEDAMKLLGQAEAQDFYYGQMNEMNKKARKYPYIVSSMNTPDIKPFEVPKWLPYTEKTITICLLEPSSDNGYPHTRGKNVICLPHFYAWKPNPSTMLHELVHISQKQYPEKWWNWYTIIWKFKPLDDPNRIPEKWRNLVRRNPDILDSPFVVWQDRYVPLTLFTNATSPDLQESQRGFYDLTRGAWMWESPPGWDTMFGQGYNDEHPHEIAAYWIDGTAGEERQKYFNLHPV